MSDILTEKKTEYHILHHSLEELKQHLEHVEQQANEFSHAIQHLSIFRKMKPGKDSFIPLSSQVFAKASIQDTTDVLLSVGANILVQRPIPAVQGHIKKQKKELDSLAQQLENQIERILTKQKELEKEIQGLEK